jgi:hypothetical protein
MKSTKSPGYTLLDIQQHLRLTFANTEPNPATRDHVYCALMFLTEAVRNSLGVRGASSRTLALKLAKQQRTRLRIYRELDQLRNHLLAIHNN